MNWLSRRGEAACSPRLSRLPDGAVKSPARASSSGKRPGRPLGSKNRPKPLAVEREHRSTFAVVDYNDGVRSVAIAQQQAQAEANLGTTKPPNRPKGKFVSLNGAHPNAAEQLHLCT